MAKWLLALVVACMAASPSLQSLDDNQVDSDDGGDFLEMASSFLQSAGAGAGQGGGAAGLAAIGGVISSMMQGDGGKNLAGDILAGMQMGNNNNNAAADVLSGIGSLFTDKNGNIDPNLIGSVISTFAESAMNKKEEAAPKKKAKKSQTQESGGIDMESILSLASAFMNTQNQGSKAKKSGGSGMEDLMQALPSLLLNTLSTFNSPEAEKKQQHDHSDHAWFLPPIFEKVHVFWDHFINSDLGKAIWENAGLSELTKTFTDKNTGRMNFEIVFKSLENHSFRRKWIKKATNYMADWVIHLANPEVQQKYLASSQFMVNGFLKSQGFPKHITLQPAKMSESITNIVNYSLKKYLDSPTDVSIYVKPAVQYMKDLLKTAQKSHGVYLKGVDKNELSDKLTDTLNLEIIEPVLKAYRAYRFALKAPHCQKHVLCVINSPNNQENLGLPGFKAGLTKLSSLVASAALSYNGGQSFLGLYQAIQDGSNCHDKYPAECDDFHEEELRVTTEYSHNEL